MGEIKVPPSVVGILEQENDQLRALLQEWLEGDTYQKDWDDFEERVREALNGTSHGEERGNNG